MSFITLCNKQSSIYMNTKVLFLRKLKPFVSLKLFVKTDRCHDEEEYRKKMVPRVQSVNNKTYFYQFGESSFWNWKYRWSHRSMVTTCPGKNTQWYYGKKRVHGSIHKRIPPCGRKFLEERQMLLKVSTTREILWIPKRPKQSP